MGRGIELEGVEDFQYLIQRQTALGRVFESFDDVDQVLLVLIDDGIGNRPFLPLGDGHAASANRRKQLCRP